MKINTHKLVLKLATLFLIVFSSTMYAQLLPSVLTATGDQVICKGDTKNYEVDYTANSRYTWTVTKIGTTPPANVTTAVITNNPPLSNPLATNAVTIAWGLTPAGDYTLTVKKLNTATGCYAADETIKVTIRNPPTSITVTAPQICNDGTTLSTITAHVTSEYALSTYSYTWTVPTGVASPGDTDHFDSKTAGTYTVDITDNYTKCKFSANAVLIVNPLPTVITTAKATVTGLTATSVCQGDTMTLKAVATAATPVSITTYRWIKGVADIPVTATNGADTDTYITDQAETYTVRVTDSHNPSCSVISAPIVITINTPPTVDIKNTAGTATIVGTTIETCQNRPVILTAKAIVTSPIPPTLQITKYQWKKGGGIILNANASTYTVNAVHSVLESGNYTVEVTDSNGCHSETPAVTVQVNPTPDSAINHTDPLKFCDINPGDGANLSAHETGAGFAYNWYKDTVIINDPVTLQPLTTSTYKATETGTYTLKVTDNNHPQTTCSSNTDVQVTKDPKPITGGIRHN